MTNAFDEVLAFLKRIEWASGHKYESCPICAALQEDGEHDLDCELMAIIKKMESTPMVARPLGTGERVRAQESHVKAAR